MEKAMKPWFTNPDGLTAGGRSGQYIFWGTLIFIILMAVFVGPPEGIMLTEDLFP